VAKPLTPPRLFFSPRALSPKLAVFGTTSGSAALHELQRRFELSGFCMLPLCCDRAATRSERAPSAGAGSGARRWIISSPTLFARWSSARLGDVRVAEPLLHLSDRDPAHHVDAKVWRSTWWWIVRASWTFARRPRRRQRWLALDQWHSLLATARRSVIASCSATRPANGRASSGTPVCEVLAPGEALANVSGVNVHAGPAIDGRDRRLPARAAVQVRRARPPVSQDRLELTVDGHRLLHRFKRAWRDGTDAVVLDPLDFIARLVALIPPPRRASSS
jgi:hypothetical protein